MDNQSITKMQRDLKKSKAIIIKSDDDIVFIDLFKFKQYINKVIETNDYDIISHNYNVCYLIWNKYY